MMMHPKHHAFFEIMQQFRSLNLLATLRCPDRITWCFMQSAACKGTSRFLHRFDDCKKMQIPQPAVIPYPCGVWKTAAFTAGSLPFRPPELPMYHDRCRKDCRTGSRPDACYVP